jgi:Subtilase family/RTX calcium-binding nonapeptide repeat (4 copies)
MGRGMLAAAIALACVGAPAVAAAAFPGTDPTESPRLNAPDDPEFDRCELDDAETPALDCTSYFDEDFRLFGFSPDTANVAPVPPQLHGTAATRYLDCSQLDAQGRAANVAAGDPECAQLAGIRADTAWKYSTGDPEVAVAILDTGIRWQDRELVDKVRLNAAELPPPRRADGAECADDCNGDGAFAVSDFADDPRVAEAAGDGEADALLDGSDLIASFSDGSDADANGYVDDIAGWDFFDDDNDPFDASSCCSAGGHGTGRAREAVAATDNGLAGPGVCPDCRLLPVRVWDSFVVPIDFFAMGTLYATENGASVVEGAVGGLGNTRFARRVFEHADEQGVALTMVSSDINSANHNYPTNYNEAIYVAGAFSDTAPFGTCDGPGSLPGIGDVVSPPEGFTEGCEELLGLLGEFAGVTPTAQPITTSFFRNSNLTQYGGKSDVVLMGSTGSENTGQAAGAAGLLASFGRQRFGDADPLSGNEIRQLLTMTAEDVLPANTGAIGVPDKAAPGWDPHFGYGRVNLAAAMKRIADDRVPPEAQIDSPDWFAPINVDRVPASGIEVTGHAAAPHSAAGVGDWELEYACGQDAPDSSFAPVPGASGTGAIDGVIGTLPASLLTDLAANCNGEVANDAGRPAGGLADGAWPADPYPDPDPERHAFQIRFTVHERGDPENFGRYRKTLFAYADDGNLPGWPRPVGSGSAGGDLVTGSGGEVPSRLFDLDGDNALDVIQPTTSGELWVLGSDGDPLPSFNGGQPVSTRPYALAVAHPPPGAVPTPRESLRAPAIGDLDGDLEPDLVAAAGERVYAWDRRGKPLPGFPVRIDPALSAPCAAGAPTPCFDAADRAITSENHIKRGIFGSPALADLDGDDRLDVVAGAMDQHVYAWDGAGEPLPGFPVKLSSPGADGAEIVTSPAIAQLDGEGPPEIVLATNEVVPGEPEFPTSLFEIPNAILSSSTGSNPVYALHGDGTRVDGWPVGVGVAAGDLLPLVLPGHDAAAFDVDGDGDDEVSLTAATGIGGLVVDGDGSTIRSYANAVGNTLDQGPILNLADYPAVGDLTGDGSPLVIKGGLTLNGAANLLAVNQNLPFSHMVQAWDPATGLAQAGYPRATDDFQLVSQPVIARVSGSDPTRQAIYGTGLYQLHAYGPDGMEAEGWPKFTGGWIYASPSVGDADADGDLDLTTLTREGWSFLWDTGADACGGANTEWWTFHHDEHGTANYGHDARPPGTARGLRAIAEPGGSIHLRWTLPGDDWLCGTADSYRVLLADAPIEVPRDGRVVTEAQAPVGAGSREFVDLTAGQVAGATHAAIMHRDEAGNWGLLAGVELPVGGGGAGADIAAAGGAVGGGAGSGACANSIPGTAGKDTLAGTEDGDRIRGRGGADRLKGRRGDDCLSGQRGGDRIGGGSGADRIKGGRGKDRLRGDSGDDVIRARRGARDRVDCGPGDDVAHVDRKRDRVRRCEELRS